MENNNLPNQDTINNLIKKKKKNEFLQVEKEIVHLLTIYQYRFIDRFKISGNIY